MAHRFNGYEKPLLFHLGRGLKIAHLWHWEIPSPRVLVHLNLTNGCREPALCRHSPPMETQEEGDTDPSMERLLGCCGSRYLSRKFPSTAIRPVMQASPGYHGQLGGEAWSLGDKERVS